MTVSWTGARAAGNWLNSATVTWSLEEFDGTEVATGSLDYTAASNGNYTGTISDSITGMLTLDSYYYLYLTLVQGGYNGKRRLACKAEYRRDQ
jgi:hypothetical protein